MQVKLFNRVDDECFESHVICTSYFEDDELCNGVFQYNDNSLILYSQFCNGVVDCFDGSDEIKKQSGFECNEYILPPSNLSDDFAHCDDNWDSCFARNDQCFHCFDKRLIISSKQMCDGVGDCYDLSDECLCDFDSKICRNAYKNYSVQCCDG